MRLAIFTFALIVRIAAIEWAGGSRVEFGDALDYMATARSVCEAGSYPERGNLPFFRAPGLPFFIAGVTACEVTRVRLIKYGLAIVDAIAAVLIASIARIIWGTVTAGAFAGLVAVANPFFWGMVMDVRGEPLFMALFLASGLALLSEKPAIAGVAVALAALTRPTGLLCIPMFVIFMVARKRGHAVRAVATFVAAAALTLVPWTARNFIRFGEVIPVNDAAGFNLWRGTHPEMMRVATLTDRAEFRRATVDFETRVVSETAREIERVARTPDERDRAWRRLAMENIRRDPNLVARSTLAKLLMYWRPWLHPAEHRLPIVLVSFLVIVPLYAFGAAGMAIHPERFLTRAALLFILAIWLAHLPYIPTIRLRAPLVDPLMIIFAVGHRSRVIRSER